MIMIRESERPRRKSRRVVESPMIASGVSAPGLASVGESVEPAAAA